ncbi:MAG: restriction endonuclease subunit S, partial [Candidatus Magasanikbacteria bacterium]
MTKTKQKYQNYKDSEVDWIAKVPKTWGVERVKSVIKDEQNGYWGSKEQNDENDVKCIRVADFDYQKLKVKDKKDFTVRNLSSDKIENLSLQKNDLLIEKSGGGDKTPVGRVVIFDKNFEAICSNFIARLKTRNNCDNKFLNYVFAWLYYIDLNTRSIKQTTGIQNLDTYQYFCEKFPLPPKKEQQKIANYLDEKTSKI